MNWQKTAVEVPFDIPHVLLHVGFPGYGKSKAKGDRAALRGPWETGWIEA